MLPGCDDPEGPILVQTEGDFAQKGRKAASKGDVSLTAAERFDGYLAIMNMSPVSCKRHLFPPAVIAHMVWLYFRFLLSLRLVEEMLWERGIIVSYETIRCWAKKFGPLASEAAKAGRQFQRKA